MEKDPEPSFFQDSDDDFEKKLKYVVYTLFKWTPLLLLGTIIATFPYTKEQFLSPSPINVLAMIIAIYLAHKFVYTDKIAMSLAKKFHEYMKHKATSKK